MHQSMCSRVIAISHVESNSCLSFPEVRDCVRSPEAELLSRALAFGWPSDATGFRFIRKPPVSWRSWRIEHGFDRV